MCLAMAQTDFLHQRSSVGHVLEPEGGVCWPGRCDGVQLMVVGCCMKRYHFYNNLNAAGYFAYYLPLL